MNININFVLLWCGSSILYLADGLVPLGRGGLRVGALGLGDKDVGLVDLLEALAGPHHAAVGGLGGADGLPVVAAAVVRGEEVKDARGGAVHVELRRGLPRNPGLKGEGRGVLIVPDESDRKKTHKRKQKRDRKKK